MQEYEKVAEQDVKSAIREFLQQIINGNKTYIDPLLALKSKLTTTSKSVRTQNAFSKILGEKNYSYFGLNLSQDLIKREQQMSELYHYYTEILTQLLGLNQLTYSIYYKDDDEKMLRITTQDITKAANIWEGQSNSLRLQGNNIRKVFNDELEEIKNEKKYTEALTSHYNDLEIILKASYKGGNNNYKKYIPEAFERDVLHYPHTINNVETFKQHQWSLQEAWDYIKLSSGNAPWYSGGDVLSKMFNVQVKGFTSGSENLNTTNPFHRITGLTTLRSLEDITNYLITLLNVTPQDLDEKVNEIYSLFNQDDWEHEVDYQIEQTSDKIIKKIMKQGGNINNFII